MTDVFVTRAHGVHGAGENTVSPETRRKALSLFRALEPGEHRTVAAVAQELGIGGRTVRALVRDIVMKGDLPICDDHRGYVVATTPEELRRAALTYRAEAAALHQRADVCEGYARALAGPPTQLGLGLDIPRRHVA